MQIIRNVFIGWKLKKFSMILIASFLFIVLFSSNTISMDVKFDSSFLSTNFNTNQNNICDLNKDGICDIFDLNLISYHYDDDNINDIYDINNDNIINFLDIDLLNTQCEYEYNLDDNNRNEPRLLGSSYITNVSVVPSSLTVGSNEIFSIDINCTPGQDIRAFQFSLLFDQTKINAINVTNVGNIFTSKGYNIFLAMEPSII